MYDNANKTTSMKITELIWLDNVMGRSNPNTTACQPMPYEVFANKPKVKKMQRGHFCGEPCL